MDCKAVAISDLRTSPGSRGAAGANRPYVPRSGTRAEVIEDTGGDRGTNEGERVFALKKGGGRPDAQAPQPPTRAR